MRVYFRSRTGKRGLAVYEQAGAPVFCCGAMRERWGRLIGFGARGHRLTTSREVSLYADRPQADGSVVLTLIPIDFCPFCGEAVELCRVK